MNSLYKKILQKITPTKQELAAEKKLVEKVRKKIAGIEGKHSHVEWCGSSARGTHLRGDRDLDLFIMFDKKLSPQELEEEGLRIGKDVFVGSDCTLVAPVSVEDGALIGAGSCITKDVPAGAMALSRPDQIMKPGWADKLKAARNRVRTK